MTDPIPPSPFRMARRAAAMNPSVIREILKLTEQPGVISFAGGLPAPASFPVEEMREACARVLADAPQAALQYAASEGYAPLREWIAAELGRHGQRVDAAQVLVTTGSQQALDLVAKVLIDAGSTVLVESPTYLGALQAFTPMEPRFAGVEGDEQGPRVEAMRAAAQGADARFFYLLPNFQNPTGHSMADARRGQIVDAAATIGLPLIEDNPYGELWFDAAPPAGLAARNPDGVIYLGSFSKVLAPGLRLGYVVAPKEVAPKLLQAKQAADLHTPGFNQRVVYEIVKDGFLDRHVPEIRALYKAQRDAMLAALDRHMPPGVRWNKPAGGMFLWVELPGAMSAADLLPQAVARGVAFVPGAPFYAGSGRPNTLRLSYVTASAAEIESGIAALGATVRAALAEAR
ncbi:MAG: PLP-dependent aminotransferase family protein [Piscinibacter sp.]|nr:PLP-dependent aminotransferase family protein [Piscinibacter sp.]